jgi:hypothetical protein
MVDTYNYFTKEMVVTGDVSVVVARNWGDGWSSCVQLFIEFQRRVGYPDVGPAFPSATNTQPSEIGIWMKNRWLWKDVGILDKEKFSEQWWNKWISLQPEPRAHGDRNNIALPTVEMDWSKLQKPGKNSFLLVMLSLVWWGKASDMDGGWLKAVMSPLRWVVCKSPILRALLASSRKPPSETLSLMLPILLVQSHQNRVTRVMKLKKGLQRKDHA